MCKFLINYLCIMKAIVAKLFRYLLQGIVILSPILITVGVAYYLFDFIGNIIPGLENRILGFFIVITTFILTGWLGSKFLVWRILIDGFDRILERTPFLKVIYTSVKDFVDGFMGEKRKFTKPVLVKMSEQPEMHRIGFVTQEDLSRIDMLGKSMVYIPHAYAISGFHYIIDHSYVSPLDLDPKEAMKLAVSGGVAGFNDEENV